MKASTTISVMPLVTAPSWSIDHEGNVLEGEGTVEKTAFFIHEAVHRLCPHAVVILHTHMPYATALSCVEGGFNETLSQNSLFFLNDVAYESFGGLANDRQEGERLASNIGEKHVALLNNHGVMIMARTPGIAIHDLYFFERAAQVQVLAQSQGKPLIRISQDVANKTAHQLTLLDEDKETYFEVWKGMLDDNEPEYRSFITS
jgi:ribulose-5-phosphate 4-epimerase/fuculose-1-phosphate aldolase